MSSRPAAHVPTVVPSARMPTEQVWMPSSVDDYEITLGDSVGPTSQVLQVIHGTGSAEVWKLDAANGEVTFHGPIECDDELRFSNRNAGTSGTIVSFLDSSGTSMVEVTQHGEWVCDNDEGIAIEVVTGGLPSASPQGRTIAYHQTLPTSKYWVAVAIAGGWKKVALPN